MGDNTIAILLRGKFYTRLFLSALGPSDLAVYLVKHLIYGIPTHRFSSQCLPSISIERVSEKKRHCATSHPDQLSWRFTLPRGPGPLTLNCNSPTLDWFPTVAEADRYLEKVKVLITHLKN